MENLTVGQMVALVETTPFGKVEAVRVVAPVVRKRGKSVTLDAGPGAMWFNAATGWADSKNYRHLALKVLTPELEAMAPKSE